MKTLKGGGELRLHLSGSRSPGNEPCGVYRPVNHRGRLHSRWTATLRKSSNTQLVRRPRRPEPPCGFSILECSLERHHQPGIRLKLQRWDEEQHALNHHLCSFQTVSPEGFTPRTRANFVLKLSLKAQTHRNQWGQRKPPKRLLYREKWGKPLETPSLSKTSCFHLFLNRCSYD